MEKAERSGETLQNVFIRREILPSLKRGGGEKKKRSIPSLRKGGGSMGFMRGKFELVEHSAFEEIGQI